MSMSETGSNLSYYHMGQTLQSPECDYQVTQKGNLQTRFKYVHMGQKIKSPNSDYQATQ